MSKHIISTSIEVERAKITIGFGSNARPTQDETKKQKSNKVYVCSGGAHAQNRGRGDVARFMMN